MRRIPDGVTIDAGCVLINGQRYALKWAVVECASAGDNEIVAAVADKCIRVIAADIVAAGAVAVRWKSGAGTNLSGPQSFAANGGIVLPSNPYGWRQTAAGEALNINLGGAVALAGTVQYIEV